MKFLISSAIFSAMALSASAAICANSALQATFDLCISNESVQNPVSSCKASFPDQKSQGYINCLCSSLRKVEKCYSQYCDTDVQFVAVKNSTDKACVGIAEVFVTAITTRTSTTPKVTGSGVESTGTSSDKINPDHNQDSTHSGSKNVVAVMSLIGFIAGFALLL